MPWTVIDAGDTMVSKSRYSFCRSGAFSPVREVYTTKCQTTIVQMEILGAMKMMTKVQGQESDRGKVMFDLVDRQARGRGNRKPSSAKGTA